MGKKAVFRKTIYYLKRNGIRKTWTAVRERLWKGGKVSYCWKPISEEEPGTAKMQDMGSPLSEEVQYCSANL